MSGRGPTSHDVAKAAGVSQSAVSRAFTPGASVSPDMRARIAAVAAELGYRPNRLPGIMRRGKSGIVAVVVGGLYNPFHTLTLDSFTRALAGVGKQTLLVRVDSDRELDAAIGDLVGLRIDGVLSALSLSSPDVAAMLDRHRLPIITLNSAVRSRWVGTVNSDGDAAGRQAARLLHASGCRRLAAVMGPADTLSHSTRAAGFVAETADVARDTAQCLHGGFDYQWGWDAGGHLLERADRPDGLFCGNDLIAAGIVDRWSGVGLSAPRDVRIIGFDNIPTADWSHYALSSFDQRTDRLAELAIEALDTPNAVGSASWHVEAELIRRRSC